MSDGLKYLTLLIYKGARKSPSVLSSEKKFSKKNFEKFLVVKNKSFTFANAFASKTRVSSLKDFI